jgi:hypothetical protein
MSGGLHPWAKYEHVVAEPCWPMKLDVVPGVNVDVADDPELFAFTPAVAFLTLAAPCPFGHRTASGLSSIDVDAVAGEPPVGETT